MQFLNEPSRTAEDDHLRSSHIRELVQGTNPIALPSDQVTIPKIILQFWHDLDALPGDVQECLDSWKPLTGKGFTRVLFDDNEARAFISREFGRPYVTAFDRCRHPAMRCDYFRLCYIYRHGGFYVDADEVYRGDDCRSLYRDNRLKIQPLCYDRVTDTMVDPEVFIGNKTYSPYWIFYVNNNPLVAPASHPIVRLALARSTRILLDHASEPLDIQSTTGPGNLTASLVQHSIASRLAGDDRDFLLITDWNSLSTSRWPLSYREDERNWRLWDPNG